MTTSSKANYSPFYLQSLKELWVLIVGFSFFLAWSTIACYTIGYRAPEVVAAEITFGVPSWIFWGIALPWTAASLFTIWYALFFIQDDDAEFLAAKINRKEGESI